MSLIARAFTCRPQKGLFRFPLPQAGPTRLIHLFKGGAERNVLSRHPKSFLTKFSRPSETFAVPAFATRNSVAQKAVGYWLLGCSGMVFGAVILGGVTRLTESGLSMVTWELFGEKPPLNLHDWQNEFEKYKQYPEFKMKNSDITLEEFKFIWLMEYGHRMWGRAIGAFFLIPATYFWAKGYFPSAMKKRVGVFGALIAAQGLMGWYMVKSGLEEGRFQKQSDVVRVSQYRLASHLTMAFLLYTGFLWSALDHLLPAQFLDKVPAATRRFRGLAHASKGLVFITALSGAFVAGLDAGLVYNSFPKMGDNWVPDEILSISPVMKNFTENPVTVQFDHRILGTLTLSVISGLWLLSRKRTLPPRAKTAANALAAMAWFQVILGISTLVHYVPVSLAALHQSGSLVLLSFAVWLTHELKHLKRVIK